MKLTDFALIFVVVFLPIVIIAYVNTSFVVKAEKNEMYYRSIINSATKDAVAAMKEVENSNIDYGYSGIVNNKVSINAYEAIDTFYSSLANNFGITDNGEALERLKMYIPVIAIMDYDGIYIHSLEQVNGKIEFVTKPKIKYTLTYVIEDTGSLISEDKYNIIDVTQVSNATNKNLLSNYMYEINFTMDDYVYLKIYNLDTKEVAVSKGFYLTDVNNNHELIFSDNITSDNEKKLKAELIKYLSEQRTKTIAELGMKHISYAVNKHNEYAKLTGIRYEFRFEVDSDESWYETMNGIGMIALIQGISLGNRHLNYKAYSASELSEAKKYYVTAALDNRYYLKYNLYHASERCEIYEYYIGNVKDTVTPAYYLSRADAATQGYYPCPICKP